MKILAYLTILVFVAISCSTDSGTETLSVKEKILGTWIVQSAVVNGSAISIQGTPFELVEARFQEDSYLYIFPKVLDNGLVSSTETDQISGSWELNEEGTKIYLDRSDYGQSTFEWDILELSVGNMRTRYYEMAAGSESDTSEYIITYQLDG